MQNVAFLLIMCSEKTSLLNLPQNAVAQANIHGHQWISQEANLSTQPGWWCLLDESTPYGTGVNPHTSSYPPANLGHSNEFGALVHIANTDFTRSFWNRLRNLQRGEKNTNPIQSTWKRAGDVHTFRLQVINCALTLCVYLHCEKTDFLSYNYSTV